MAKYNINASVGVGVIGTEFISKTKSGDTTKIEIIRGGLSNAHFIPPLIIFCEDRLAKEIITFAISRYNLNLGSYKIIECGSWMNIITSLFGCILYAQQLKESGNNKIIEVVGIIDGDIKDNEISELIESTYKGNFIPGHLKQLIDLVTNHISSFKLNHNKDSVSNKNIKIKGIPELNIKKMFEQIDRETVLRKHQEKKNEYELRLNGASKETQSLIQFELFDINSKIEETLQLVDISKNIGSNKFKSRGQYKGTRIDYHRYFDIMKKRIGIKHYNSYAMSHDTITLILRIIFEYNNNAWVEYSEPVCKLLKSAYDRQVNNFCYDTFNNNRI